MALLTRIAGIVIRLDIKPKIAPKEKERAKEVAKGASGRTKAVRKAKDTRIGPRAIRGTVISSSKATVTTVGAGVTRRLIAVRGSLVKEETKEMLKDQDRKRAKVAKARAKASLKVKVPTVVRVKGLTRWRRARRQPMTSGVKRPHGIKVGKELSGVIALGSLRARCLYITLTLLQLMWPTAI